MSNINLYKLALIISPLIILIGALFKIQHWPGANLFMSSGLIIGLIYIIIALIDIYKTENYSIIVKILWLIGFIVMPWIIGAIYYFDVMKPKSKLE